MSPDDDFTVEVPKRLASLCKLYMIEQANPLWERRLLMTLLHRHVKGFRFQAKRGSTVDSIFLIETIKAVKDRHEEKTGTRPSTDAVVTEMLSSKKENPDIADMTRARLMRIFSGRKELWEKAQERFNRARQSLAKWVRSMQALQKLPADSHARLFWDAIRNRAAKQLP